VKCKYSFIKIISIIIGSSIIIVGILAMIFAIISKNYAYIIFDVFCMFIGIMIIIINIKELL
jgi:hypothetical protein